QHVPPVRVASGVEVNTVVANHRGQRVDDNPVPVGPARLPAADELDGGIGQLHHRGELARFCRVGIGGGRADLPVAVHFVAESPVPNVVWLRVPVGAAQVRPVRVAGAVAVLNPGLRLVHTA